MNRTALVAGAVILVLGCTDKMDKSPAGVCAKMKELAEAEGGGAQFDKAECLAMMADYPERDAEGFAVLATCMDAARDANGAQACLMRGFAFAPENEPTEQVRSAIRIEREIKIRADPKVRADIESSATLNGKRLADVTRQDLLEAIREKGWEYKGSSSMVVGADETVVVEGTKDDKKMTVTIIRPSGREPEDPDPGSKSTSAPEHKKASEENAAVYKDGDVLIAIEVEGDSSMAKKLLSELVEK